MDLFEHRRQRGSRRIDESFYVCMKTFNSRGERVSKVWVLVNKTGEKLLFERENVCDEVVGSWRIPSHGKLGEVFMIIRDGGGFVELVPC